MASAIPRRATRRINENEPTGLSTTTTANSASGIPRLKRGTSSTTVPPVAGTVSTKQAKGVIPAPTKRVAKSTDAAGTNPEKAPLRSNGPRNALVEVTNGRGAPVASSKPKETSKVRQPLAATRPTTQSNIPAVRRTRASAANASGKSEVESTIPAVPVFKRKATSTIPPAARSEDIKDASHRPPQITSSSRQILREQPTNEAKAVEPEPVRKKRKTSSPALEQPHTSEAEDDEVDIRDDGYYDGDGQEIVLSSGSKGTTLRSPKAPRAKDYGWTDLDREDEGDPGMVAEYVVDAFEYMVRIETQTMPQVDYMDSQPELKWAMRSVLVDWLIEVHGKFRLLPETLFIAVNLIDRYLSARVCSLNKMQLMGITALFIAAKYEEVICPSIENFAEMTDGGSQQAAMLEAERYLLSVLEFDMSYPNPLNFLRRISKADGYDLQTRTVAKYLVEIPLMAHQLIKYTPSMTAAAAMFLARVALDRGEWTPNHVHYSGYSVMELLPCAQGMLDYILDPEFDSETVFHRKYAQKKHMKSSVYMHRWARDRWPASAQGRYQHHDELARVYGP